jgi:L-lysine exporter family protein LysE/ArgO
MSLLFLGFITGLSLILPLGAQNIFVIEQGLKKNYIFLVCLICTISDLILIFLGIFIFEYFQNFLTLKVNFFLNLLLLLFLLRYIWIKIKKEIYYKNILFKKENNTLSETVLKTLGFTYLNPHVYSDTVFFLGNFSKNFLFNQKIYFGLGASFASILFFFAIGYLSKHLSHHLQNAKAWKLINIFIIIFMVLLSFFVLSNLINFYISS